MKVIFTQSRVQPDFEINGIYISLKEQTDSISRGIRVQLDLCLIKKDN